jgi:hypothetical protein
MPGHRGPGPLGGAGRPDIVAEPAAPSVFLSQDVPAGTAGRRAQRLRHAGAEFVADSADPAAPSVCIAQSAAEHAAGPGPRAAQRVLSRAGTSAYRRDELHDEPERRGQ